MGYTTDFTGSFKLNKPLDPNTLQFLIKFNETRRMRRHGLPLEFGVEGEFFVDGKGMMGQDKDETVVDYNRPPMTQPGLWCQWRPSEDGTQIEWDGGEKFYNYVEWIQYIVDKILVSRGYSITGTVQWCGEDSSDQGQIVADDNKIKVLIGRVVFEESKR